MKSQALSARQQQILQLASEGKTDKEIARTLVVAEGTLRTYWERLRHRFSAHSRAEVIAKAMGAGESSILRQYMVLRMPLFIWTAKPSGYVDFVNDWFTIYGGVTPEAALGAGCRVLMRKEDLPDSEARWAQAQQTGEGYEAYVDLRCEPEDTYRKHKIRLMPHRDASGTIVKWIGYGRELADNADERLCKFLIDAIPL